MINRVNDGDTLEDIKIKLNEVIDVLVFDNPSDRIEQVAKKHLTSHNAEISKIRTDIIASLASVKEQVVINQELKFDIENYKTNTEKEFTSFKTDTNKELSKFKTEMKSNLNSFKEKINKDFSDYKTDIDKNFSKFKTEMKNNFSDYKTDIDKNFSEKNKMLSEFKTETKNISTSVEDKMKQFITFYAQVGLHIKEMCDGKK